MRRRFATLDVFTDRRFAGNPLAVVLDAEGLDDAAMQTIAREFNLPETVFVFPPADSAHRARLRIFTPANELPFAGHPTVGAAVLFGRLDAQGAADIVLEEKIGPVHCHVELLDADRGRARFLLPRLPEYISDAGEAANLVAALGLELDDLGGDHFEPGRWSAGVPFAIIPLRGRDAVARARPDLTCWEAAFGAVGPRSAYVFCHETMEKGHAFHARMFAPHMGIPEDPATGSAVAAFAGMIAQSAKLPDGEHPFVIEQGYEMGRPSLIRLTLTIRDGALAAATIGGDAVVVSEGMLEA
jgi:trans-2,3-dihydro-3-hydroxyanthranilate isomerase